MIYKEFIDKISEYLQNLAKGIIEPLEILKEYEAKDISPKSSVPNPDLARKKDMYLAIKRCADMVYITHVDILKKEEDEVLYLKERLKKLI